MDPKVTLGDIRTASTEVLRITGNAPASDMTSDDIAQLSMYAGALAMNVRALDKWLSNGGTFPGEWLVDNS